MSEKEWKTLTRIFISPGLKTIGWLLLVALSFYHGDKLIGYAGTVMLASWHLLNWAKGAKDE